MGDQFIKLNGFTSERAEWPEHVGGWLRLTTQDQHRNACVEFAKSGEGAVNRTPGHVDIEYDESRVIFASNRDRLGGVGGFSNLMTEASERHTQNSAHEGIVIGDEHRRAHSLWRAHA